MKLFLFFIEMMGPNMGHGMRFGGPNSSMNQSGPMPINSQPIRSSDMPLSPGSMNSQMQNMRQPMAATQQMPMHQNQQMQIPQGMSPMGQPPGVPMQQPVSMSSQPLPPQQLPQQPQPGQPAPQQLPQKQGRITGVPKPAGIDPLLILQERENRYQLIKKILH